MQVVNVYAKNMGKEKRDKFESLRLKLNKEGLQGQPLQRQDHLGLCLLCPAAVKYEAAEGRSPSSSKPQSAKYAKFEVKFYNGHGGGLQYFEVAGRPLPCS